MIRARRIAALVAVASCVAAGCEGQDAALGLREPVRVRGAQFISGPLPGAAPGSASVVGPTVTSVTSQSRIVLPGQTGKAFDGRVSGASTSVAVRFSDLGTGYWVFLLSGPDALFPSELSWHADLDFSRNFAAQAGFHPLRFVAIDSDGVAGEQVESELCLAPAIPDNLHACDPSLPPPDAVISIAWDSDADLDLRVVTPDGVSVDAKHWATSRDDAGAPAPGAGQLDRDSLLACVPDGRRQENLVWQQRPRGVFDVYASLFDACGKPSTRYELTIYEATGDMPNRQLVAKQTVRGIATSLEATGGSSVGQYLTSYSF